MRGAAGRERPPVPGEDPDPGSVRPRVLVAGMGNVLHEDDGFGVRVTEALEHRDRGDGAGSLPPEVEVVEVGIGGLHLVQELMDGYEALIIVDAVKRDRAPGTVSVLRPRLPDDTEYSDEERREILRDTHHTVPAKVLLVARAMEVLPPETYIVGCEPERAELGIGMSEVALGAVEEACDRIGALASEILEKAEEAS